MSNTMTIPLGQEIGELLVQMEPWTHDDRRQAAEELRTRIVGALPREPGPWSNALDFIARDLAAALPVGPSLADLLARLELFFDDHWTDDLDDPRVGENSTARSGGGRAQRRIELALTRRVIEQLHGLHGDEVFDVMTSHLTDWDVWRAIGTAVAAVDAGAEVFARLVERAERFGRGDMARTELLLAFIGWVPSHLEQARTLVDEWRQGMAEVAVDVVQMLVGEIVRLDKGLLSWRDEVIESLFRGTKTERHEAAVWLRFRAWPDDALPSLEERLSALEADVAVDPERRRGVGLRTLAWPARKDPAAVLASASRICRFEPTPPKDDRVWLDLMAVLRGAGWGLRDHGDRDALRAGAEAVAWVWPLVPPGGASAGADGFWQDLYDDVDPQPTTSAFSAWLTGAGTQVVAEHLGLDEVAPLLASRLAKTNATTTFLRALALDPRAAVSDPALVMLGHHLRRRGVGAELFDGLSHDEAVALAILCVALPWGGETAVRKVVRLFLTREDLQADLSPMVFDLALPTFPGAVRTALEGVESEAAKALSSRLEAGRRLLDLQRAVPGLFVEAMSPTAGHAAVIQQRLLGQERVDPKRFSLLSLLLHVVIIRGAATTSPGQAEPSRFTEFSGSYEVPRLEVVDPLWSRLLRQRLVFDVRTRLARGTP